MQYLRAAFFQSPFPSWQRYGLNMAALLLYVAMDSAGWQPHARITPFECVIALWLLGRPASVVPRLLAGRPDDEMSPTERVLIVVSCLIVFVVLFGACIWWGTDWQLIVMIAVIQMLMGVGKTVINQWMPEDRKFLPVEWVRYPGWASHATWFFAMEDLLRALILIQIARSGDPYLAMVYIMVLDNVLHKAAHMAFMIAMWAKDIDAHSDET